MRTRVCAIALIAVLCAPFEAEAQTSAPAPAAAGTISGTVSDSNGKPVGGAQISLLGPQGIRQARTAPDGSFTVSGISPGSYTVVVTRGGFETARESGVIVLGAEPTVVRVSLVPSSFSSLRVIGSTTTGASGRSQINTTPSAVSVVNAQTYADQGQVQIQTLLNETPGIITTHVEQNGASQGSDEEVQIRGGLPYETESLIDGHPLSIGASGNYNPILLSPSILQDIEVVKGPGSFPTEINGAINGTVNYRTLEPTRTPQQSVTFGSDQYGGFSTAVRFTGSIPNHFVDYAFAYATNGTSGQYLNYPAPSSTTSFDYLGGAPYFVNGQQIAQPTTVFAPSSNPRFIGYPGEIQLSQPLYFCCSPLNLGFHQTNELAKIRFNISQQTALTVSYLGGADSFDNNGAELQYFTGNGINFFNFTPPAGYTGSVPAGTQAYFDDNAGLVSPAASNTGLFQTELRSALGNVTFLGRYYSSYENDLTTALDRTTQKLNAWGGVLLCPAGDTAVSATASAAASCTLPGGGAGPAPTLTFFNDTPVTIGGTGGAAFNQLNTDHARGESFALFLNSGENVFTVAFDRSNHDSTEYLDEAIAAINSYQLAPGSGQQYTTYSAKANLAITKGLSAVLADYFINYKSHFSGNSGATFSDSSHSDNAPRLALTDKLDNETSLRFSAGASIAPPYISLLSAAAGAPVPNIPAAPNYFTENVNNGQIKPETAFGYDLGFDRRLAPRMTLSGDVYLTNLRNSFLSQTFQDGTYTATSGAAIGQTAPLFVTQTSNLGQSRYEGIEAAVNDNPISGYGFKLQGALMRAYPYNIPNSLYATSSGPYTTNLAVIPNVNYQPSLGIGFNGVGGSGGRVPYSQGYAELNYRKKQWYWNLGLTYYGPNNSFNEPAFAVLSGNVRYSFGKAGSLQLSGYNLGQAYATPYYQFFAGVPVPLVSGSHGVASGNLGVTEAGNVGPAVYRVIYSINLGK